MYSVSSSPSLLVSRRRLELSGRGLSLADGAARIIKAISDRRVVTSIILGHNPLGDDGCKLLFDWLSSPAGRQYGIQVIYLNSCNIGDRGLMAISRYLNGNTGLRELWLQANPFVGVCNVVSYFVESLNSSRLELLSLSNTLPRVITSLVQQLDAPYLRELQCSMCSLQPENAPHLAAYITSSRCRLHTFKANANSIGLRAVRDFVTGVRRANYSLLHLDLYMNGSADDDLPEDVQAKENTARLLKDILTRNTLLKRAAGTEALSLLHYSRLLLLPSILKPSDPSKQGSRGRPFTFCDLPTEIQLHVLSFLTPVLSSSQRVRICAYASNPMTLPALLPNFGRSCLPDPMNLHFASPSGCDSGHCMGFNNSLVCNRGEARKTWLALVGCDRYEPELRIYEAG